VQRPRDFEDAPVRIVHLSDIHFWRYAFHPMRLLSKRLLGTASLVLGRGRRFRLERVPELLERVQNVQADHILITGDLTTTALNDEFHHARSALSALLDDPAKVTILPGNHDRYTLRAHRSQRFEHYFGAFAPQASYPWLRELDGDTAILGLDPTRPGISAKGKLPHAQLAAAAELVASARAKNLFVACHYPVAAPPEYAAKLARKPIVNAAELAAWLKTIGPHIYCCGHVHASWAFRPHAIPNQLCLNPGAPLMHDRHGHQKPGFLEITIDGGNATVEHHYWDGAEWGVRTLYQAVGFWD
jgi:3',5'-cyclic AMP phosphodiesterase CpdA